MWLLDQYTTGGTTGRLSQPQPELCGENVPVISSDMSQKTLGYVLVISSDMSQKTLGYVLVISSDMSQKTLGYVPVISSDMSESLSNL